MKRVHRFDFGAVGAIERTPQGGIRVPATLTRTGVLTYSDGAGKTWNELRPPEEVFDPASMATLHDAPVTVDHPSHLVSAATWKADAVGHACNDVHKDGEMVAATLVIQDANAVAQVEAKTLCEISVGYTCDVEPTSGVTEAGEPYSAIQRQIAYNHAALLTAGAGRAGPDVGLRMDGAGVEVSPTPPSSARSAPTVQRQQPLPLSGRAVRMDAQEHTMRTVLKVGKREFKVDAGGLDAAQTLIDEQDAAMTALGANKDKIQAMLDEEKAKVAKLESMLAAAQAATAAADAAAMPMAEDKIPPAVLDAAVSKRIALFDGARKILGTDAKLDGKTADAIRREVIVKRLPKMDAAKVAALSGDVLGTVYEQALALHAALPTRNDALAAANEAATAVDPATGTSTRADAVEDDDPAIKMRQNSENRWNRQPAEAAAKGTSR